MNKYFINQKERIIINLVSLMLLVVANYILHGTFLPQFNNHGLWFLCCFLNIILANQLLTPYFTKPVDSISFSITGFVTIRMIQPEEYWNTINYFIYDFILFYTILVVVASIICIIFHGSKNESLSELSEKLKLIISFLGTAHVIFSLILLFSLITYHYQNPKEILIICTAYILFIIQSPFNFIFILSKRLVSINQLKKKVVGFGEIVAYQEPNIIIIKQESESNIPYMTGIIIKDQYSLPKLGYLLDTVGKSDGVLSRVFIFETTNNVQIINDIKDLAINSVILVKKEYLVNNKIFVQDNKIIGIVASETSIEYMNFEVTLHSDINAGALVSTKIRGKEIIYQIVNGLTKEEIIQKKNTFGYINVLSRKIGEWDNDRHRFIPNAWLPMVNTEVMIPCGNSIDELDEVHIPIGLFPNSSYPVYINELNYIVTHNTAILGILGIGKSMLSIELVERLIGENIRVIVLDLTNQYQSELKEFIDIEYENRCLRKIIEAGKEDRDKYEDNPNNGGSISNFVEAIRQDINDLLNNKENRKLKIYNPGQLFATRQYNEPKPFRANGGDWGKSAQLYALTPVEITKIVSEVALDLVSDEMRDKAKLCLVLEEAHSLVPEFGAVVAETDKNATNGTARAILQGRKFGFGCILVTQRTANVTKTILNQCNNIFAMRTFDDTGKTFLANYIGNDYTNVLSLLKERQAVYFGKSSSCENPVLIQLNDRNKFLSDYRKNHPLREIKKESISNDQEDGFSDDIPF